MIEIASYSINGFVAGGTAIFVYFVTNWIRTRSTKKNLAILLNAEISDNRSKFSKQKGFSNPIFEIDVYNGLLSSANMQYFDISIQKKLRELYSAMKENRQKAAAPLFGALLIDLECMRIKNGG